MKLKKYEKLKPCPFCGGEAKINRIVNTFYQYARYFSSCTRCSAESKVFETEQEAIEAWNTRAERTCHPFVSPDGAGWYAIGCDNCGHGFVDNNPDKAYLLKISKRSDIMPRYCPNCGAKVIQESEKSS